MRIRDSAMSRSYAHFCSFYSRGHSSRHELDHVSIIQSRAVNFCNCDRIGNIAIGVVLHSYVFKRWRVRTSPTHVPVTWESRVTSSLKLGQYARDVIKELHQDTNVPDVPLDSFVSPGSTYCPCKCFFILPSKILFLIYNSHDLKKSIGNLKCETSSWSCGHFYLINAAWGSRVEFFLTRQA